MNVKQFFPILHVNEAVEGQLDLSGLPRYPPSVSSRSPACSNQNIQETRNIAKSPGTLNVLSGLVENLMRITTLQILAHKTFYMTLLIDSWDIPQAQAALDHKDHYKMYINTPLKSTLIYCSLFFIGVSIYTKGK